MDFTSLTTYFVPVVIVACLVVGYIIKHATLFKKLPNGDIPVILAAVGIVVNLIKSGVSVESVVFGAMMGLTSTGLYEAFKNFVEGKEADNIIMEDLEIAEPETIDDKTEE